MAMDGALGVRPTLAAVLALGGRAEALPFGCVGSCDELLVALGAGTGTEHALLR